MNTIQRPEYNNPDTFLDALRYRTILSVLGFAVLVMFLETLRVAVIGEEIQLPVLMGFVIGSGGFVLAIRSPEGVRPIGTFVLLAFAGVIFFVTFTTTIIGLSALLLTTGALLRSRFAYGIVVLAIIIRIAIHDIPIVGTVGSLFELSFPFVTGVMLLSFVIRLFIVRFEEFLLELRRASDLLSATSTIGQVIGQYLELQPLLSRAVESLRDRLGYYHVQVFLTDDTNTRAYVASSTGEVGRLLMTQKRSISLNDNNIISRAIQSGESLIIREMSLGSGSLFNDLLPNTRSELVLPIVDGERIIGAVDIQSMRTNAFNRNDVQAIEVMTNQLATAIRNARLFADQERTIRENKRLFLESETNLREIERLNRQLTKQAWDDYLSGRGVVNGVTWSRQEFRPGAEWSDQMMKSAQRRRPMTVEQPEESRRTIAVPIELRGEVVGAIQIETSAELYATETIDMLQAISQRLGVSLDNARLFEETQEATAQEQRIGEIVAEYQSAGNIEDLLYITIEGLTEALGAERGAIRLGKLPDDVTPQPVHQGNGGGN